MAEDFRPVAFAMNLGFTIAALIGGGAVLGYFIGGRFGAQGAGAIIGATVGLASTIAYLVIRIRALTKS
jgi:hypothetical protein